MKLAPVLVPSADDEALLKQVVDYYHATIKESPEALSYLQGRGLQNAEMVEHFRIGFANRTLAYRLPQKNRKTGGESRGGLQRLGILRESGHEHFNGSIVIPIVDEVGRVTEMYGRKITPRAAARHAAAPVLAGSAPGHLQRAGATREPGDHPLRGAARRADVLVRGLPPRDVELRGRGFHRRSPERVSELRSRDGEDRLRPGRGGDRAAEKLSEELNAMGIDTYRVLFPKGMDANEYALKVQPAAKSLDVALRHAQWMGKGRRPAVAMPDGAAEIAPVAESAEELTFADHATRTRATT